MEMACSEWRERLYGSCFLPLIRVHVRDSVELSGSTRALIRASARTNVTILCALNRRDKNGLIGKVLLAQRDDIYVSKGIWLTRGKSAHGMVWDATYSIEAGYDTRDFVIRKIPQRYWSCRM